MPFFTATDAVRSLLYAGALRLAEQAIGRGLGRGDILSLLRRDYPLMSGAAISYQAYSAIISRAESALASGAALQRKRSNATIGRSEHTGMIGLPQEYQYGVRVDFLDEASGRHFSKVYFVGGDSPIGKLDVLEAAQVMAQLDIERGASGTDPRIRPTATIQSARIKDALARIE